MIKNPYVLHASPVPSGNYRVIFDNHCMPDLMGAFGSIFSAEAAQKGMSLLAGQEGQMVAAECVTLMDDPHMPGGLASSGFDAEGVATYTKAVIENGKLNTLLHNLRLRARRALSPPAMPPSTAMPARLTLRRPTSTLSPAKRRWLR